MNNNNIPYRVERTRNQHSRAHYQDDTIVIRLARNLNAKTEKEHIENLLKRMTKQVLKDVKREKIDPFRLLLEGKSEDTITIANGTSYLYQLSPGKKTGATKTEQGWLITIDEETRGEQLHRLFWKTLAQAEVNTVARQLNVINKDTLQVPVSRFRLGHARSQWGSCNTKGVIMLNTALLFVPKELLDYVSVHELCHRKIADHSPQYWELVEEFYPNWKAARRQLRGFKLISL